MIQKDLKPSSKELYFPYINIYEVLICLYTGNYWSFPLFNYKTLSHAKNLPRKKVNEEWVCYFVGFHFPCDTAFGERDIMIAIILNRLTLLNNQPRMFWKRKKVQLQFQCRKLRCYFWPDHLNSEYYFMDKLYQLINMRIDKGSNEYKSWMYYTGIWSRFY